MKIIKEVKEYWENNREKNINENNNYLKKIMKIFQKTEKKRRYK